MWEARWGCHISSQRLCATLLQQASLTWTRMGTPPESSKLASLQEEGWEECRTLKTKHAKGSANSLRVWKPSKESDLIRLAVWKDCTACGLENRPRENQLGSCPNKAGIHWDWPEVRPWRELPRWYSGKESTCQRRRCWLDPWVGKIPWRRKWQPTPVFLPGKFHGQSSLVGYSPRGHKESDTTEHEQKEDWDQNKW